MKTTRAQRSARQKVLSEFLRRIRSLRELTRQDVARRMGLESRSFDRFEAGEVRLDLERLFDFAVATNSDPLAMVASLWLERPELARRCADNKLLLVQAISLERLSTQLGDRLSKIDPATWMDLHDRLTDELVRELDARDARAREWLDRPPKSS